MRRNTSSNLRFFSVTYALVRSRRKIRVFLVLLASPRFTVCGKSCAVATLARLRKVKSRRRTFRVRRKSATLLRILRRTEARGVVAQSLTHGKLLRNVLNCSHLRVLRRALLRVSEKKKTPQITFVKSGRKAFFGRFRSINLRKRRKRVINLSLKYYLADSNGIISAFFKGTHDG